MSCKHLATNSRLSRNAIFSQHFWLADINLTYGDTHDQKFYNFAILSALSTSLPVLHGPNAPNWRKPLYIEQIVSACEQATSIRCLPVTLSPWLISEHRAIL